MGIELIMSVCFYVERESISESHTFYLVACIHEDANSNRVSRIRIYKSQVQAGNTVRKE